MQKLQLLIVLMAISVGCFAQEPKVAGKGFPTQKNNKVTGANILMLVEPDGLGPNPSGGQYHMAISPRFGYFVSDNLAIGIEQTFSNEHMDRYDVQTLHTKFGAFGRFYPGKVFRRNGEINKLRFFAEAGVAYGAYSNTNDDYGSINSVLDLRIMPGVNYFLNRHIALEFALNGTFEFPDMGKQGRFIYSPNLGLQFLFGGR
jgi:hypothetical protein